MNGLTDFGPMTVATLLLLGLLAAATFYYRRRWKSAVSGDVDAVAQAGLAEACLKTAPAGRLVMTLPGRNPAAAPPDRETRTDLSPQLLEALQLDAAGSPGLEEVLSQVRREDATHLRDAVAALCETGAPFKLRATRADGGRVFDIAAGRTEPTGETPAYAVLWFLDVSADALLAERAQAETRSLRTWLDALPMPLWRRSRDLTITDCNEAYARALDTTPQAVLEQNLPLLGRNKAQQARALAEQALANGEGKTEAHHVVIDGARQLLEINERVLAGDGLAGYAIDKTSLEELQSELGRHIRIQAEVLEDLGTAIAIFGPDLQLNFFNSAYVELWGIDEAFFQSEPHLGDVLEALRERRRLPEYPDFPAFKKQWIKRFGTLIEPVEELVHLPNGTTLRMLATPHPLGGVLFSYEDVTDRLALERSYNTLIDVQSETLDKLYEGVAVYGVDGRLKLYNPAFAKIWNLSEELLKTEPHARVIMESARDFFDVPDEAWADYLEDVVAATTEPQARNGRRERKDGSVIDWAQVPLPDGAVLYTFVDVTDSIRVERALMERNEALETADRLKSEFIANISYELRTPLNAIIGFAEILEKQLFGALNERQRGYSRGILESSQHLITLINDILDLASIEAGYLQMELGPTDMRELMDSIHALGRERARNQGIDLILDCPDDIGDLLVDGRRLKQAIFNLLSNALKFTDTGGTVTLAVRRVEGEMLVSVTDTGIGIAEADRERVFGTFERGTAQKGQSGAGLGLALVKSLIELHGGWVEMDTAVDRGTKVVCHLPLDPKKVEAAAECQPKAVAAN